MLTKTLQPRTCDEFIRNLRRSNLIERSQLEQVLEAFLRKRLQADPAALAEYLVKKQILSPYQAERLLKGDAQDLVVGPYVCMADIGSGSMGSVFRAVSRSDNQAYAIKVLPRRSMWNVRLAKRQVRSFAGFTHPAVVPFVDVGAAGSVHYLAWPLVDGETLEQIVQRDGALAPATAAHYALLIAAGLAEAHAHQLFHGLLKPSNVMITADHEVRILDFGIGAVIAENRGDEASMFNTGGLSHLLTSGMDCGSPESILDPTHRTPAGDQYSLGCTLYYCLTGRYPFEGNAIEKIQAHNLQHATPIHRLNPEVPELLSAIVERMMQKAPRDRFRDMREVMDALRPLAQAPVSLTQTPAPRFKLPTRDILFRKESPVNDSAAPEPADQASPVVPRPPTMLSDSPTPPSTERLRSFASVFGILALGVGVAALAWMLLVP